MGNKTYFEYFYNRLRSKEKYGFSQKDEFMYAQKQLNLNLGNYLYEYQKQKLYDDWINSEKVQQLPQERKEQKNGKHSQIETFSKSPSTNNLKKSVTKSASYPQYIEQINGIYEGDLDMNYKKEGLGIFIEDQGEMYIGEWSNDQMHGEGILHFRFGGFLYGKFKQNKVHGIAILNIPQKNQLFVGYWKQSSLHGVCFELNLNNKQWCLSVYENGELKEKQITEPLETNSQGMVYPKIMDPYEDIKFWMSRQSSKQYFQERLEKNIISQSKYIKYVNIDKGIDYIGFIEDNNFPQGLGLVKCDKGFIYGQFSNGILEGYGRMVLDNGDIYDGYYRKGQLNGQGYYFNFEKKIFMHAIFEDNIPKIYQTEDKYRADLIKKERSEQHKSHRRFYAKFQHLEKLVFKILKNYEDFYRLGQLGIDNDINSINNMFQQSKINNNQSRNFIDTISSQNVQFTQVFSPQSQKIQEIVFEKQPESQQVQQLAQIPQPVQQQNILTSQSMNQTIIQNQQNNSTNKINGNGNLQVTSQQQLPQISQLINQQKNTSNSNSIQGNLISSNSQNLASNNSNSAIGVIQTQQASSPPQQQIQQQQQLNQQQLNTQQQQSLQNQQQQQFNGLQQQNQVTLQTLNRSESGKQLSQQSFSENIVESPNKIDNKNDIKGNLVSGSVIQGNRQALKSQKRDSKFIEPPNIKKPQDLQYNASLEQFEKFQKLQEGNKQYTAQHQYLEETEFEMGIDPSKNLFSFKKINTSQMSKSQRRKIFEDNPRQQLRDSFQDSRSLTARKEMTRDDSVRSTLSQQKYRKNNYMKEINSQQTQNNRSQQNMQKGIVTTHDEEKKLWENDNLGNNEDKVDNNQAEHFCILIRDLQKNEKKQSNPQGSQQNDGNDLSNQNTRRYRIFERNTSQKFVDDDFEQENVSSKSFDQKTIGQKLLQKQKQNKENEKKFSDTRSGNSNNIDPSNFGNKQFEEFVYSLVEKCYQENQLSNNKLQPIELQNFENTRKESKYFRNEFRLKEQDNIVRSSLTPKRDHSKKKIFDKFTESHRDNSTNIKSIQLENQSQIRDDNYDYTDGPSLSQGFQKSFREVQNFQQNYLKKSQIQNQNGGSYRNQFENNSQFQGTDRFDYQQSQQSDRFNPKNQTTFQTSYQMSPYRDSEYQ